MRQFLFALAAAAAWIWSSAAMAAPPLEAYGKLPGIERVELSPSGDRYAIIGSFAGKRQLVVMAPGKTLAVAEVGEAKIRDLLWAGDSRVVLISSGTYNLGASFTVAKHEIDHALVVNVETGKATPILSRGAADNGVWGTYGFVEEKGRWFGYFGGITMERGIDGEYHFAGGHPDLYKVDLDTGHGVMAAQGAVGGNTYRDWLLGADGKVVATFDIDERRGYWRMAADGNLVAQGEHPYGDVGFISQGRTPGTVIYHLPDEEGAPDWFERPLAGGDAAEVFPDEAIFAPIEDARTRLLIGYLRNNEKREPVFFDAKRQGRMRKAQKAFPGLNTSLVSWNDAFDRLVIFTDGPQDSGSWFLVDLRTGKADAIGYSYPLIPPADVGPMKTVSYKAADGLGMEGVLTLPPGREAKSLPLVVLPHGGPAARDYPDFDWWAQAFASRGYAVFQPNFRGSLGYSNAFHRAGEGEWGGKMQTDISDGVAELVRQGVVDPKRACIVGASYGGYAALAGVTLQRGLYRCAVSVAGVSDLPDLFTYDRRATGNSAIFLRNWERDVGKGRELRAISPARLAERADAPVLLIHGKDDTVVPLGQSNAMERALKRAGKPVEFVVLKGEDHWLSRGDTRLQMLEAAVGFVEKHNPAN